jgi:hypothetical protein
MALNIELPGDYKISSDSMNILVQRKHIVDPSLSPTFKEGEMDPTIREEWRTWKWTSTITQAIDIILQQRIRESNATELSELRDEIAEFKHGIQTLMYGGRELR